MRERAWSRDLEQQFLRACLRVEAEQGHAFVKLNRVIEETARATGRLTAELSCWLDDQGQLPEVDEPLVERSFVLVRTGGCVEGQGNYGGPDWPLAADDDENGWPPAHPRYLECRLTTRGRRQLQDADRRSPA